MSWLSKLSGSDAKKRNVRKLEDQAKQFALEAAAGNPQAGADAFTSGVEDWSRTNNRVNLQTGIKGAAVAAGIGALGAPSAAAVPGKTGIAAKLGGLVKGAGSAAASAFKNKDGGFDMGKLAALLIGASSIKGSADKRKGADEYNAANAALRQQMFDKLGQAPDYSALLERITARPNYTFK